MQSMLRSRLRLPSASRRPLSLMADAFFSNFEPPPKGDQKTATGRFLEHSVNLRRARPGDRIKPPYEVTVGGGMMDLWQSHFYSHDRINTSAPFARSLGFQDQVLPFHLMCYLTGSMSHADAAVVQIAYRDAHYLWPGFPGDTFNKAFRVKALRTTSDGRHSAFDFLCELINQRGKVCFRCEKTMLFPFQVAPSQATLAPEEPLPESMLAHVVKQSEKLAEMGGQSLKRLRAGSVILHSDVRALSQASNMSLSSLARLTHPKHFNTARYDDSELLVPGGIVLALATSLAARDLHEVLFEEMNEGSFINPFRPGEAMGSLTFVKKVETHVNGVLERLSLRTIGIKGIETSELEGKPLPLRLLEHPGLRHKEVEKICAEDCPELSGRVVVIADRSILRQAPKTDVFLL